jgi:hypothetical protein
MSIDFPSWFEYTLDDFINKNNEVWKYISELELKEIIELYVACESDEEIEPCLTQLIYEENFDKYENDINNFVDNNKCGLFSFDKKLFEFVNKLVDYAKERKKTEYKQYLTIKEEYFRLKKKFGK